MDKKPPTFDEFLKKCAEDCVNGSSEPEIPIEWDYAYVEHPCDKDIE